MTEPTFRWLEPPMPDYALIYSKISHHVAAASAFLVHDDASRAQDELVEALSAIRMFETPSPMIIND